MSAACREDHKSPQVRKEHRHTYKKNRHQIIKMLLMAGKGRETVTAWLCFADSHFFWSHTTSSWRHKASSAGWASHLRRHVKRRDQKTCLSPGFSFSLFSVCCSSQWSNQVRKRPQNLSLSVFIRAFLWIFKNIIFTCIFVPIKFYFWVHEVEQLSLIAVRLRLYHLSYVHFDVKQCSRWWLRDYWWERSAGPLDAPHGSAEKQQGLLWGDADRCQMGSYCRPLRRVRAKSQALQKALKKIPKLGMKTSLSPCCFLHLLAASRKFCSGFTPSIKRKTSRGRRPGWRTVILTLALTERRRSMTWCCSRWGRTEEANWQIQNVGCSCSLRSSEVHFCCVEAEIRTDSADCFNLNIFFPFFCSPSPSVSQSIKPPSSTDTGHQGTDRQREGWGAFLRWSAHLDLTNWTSSQTRRIGHSESSAFI